MRVLVYLLLAAMLAAVPSWAQFSNATSIQGRPVDPKAPANGQALCFDTSTKKWTPAACLNAGPTGPAGSNGAGYAATSTTSLAIGTGSTSFTTQSGLAYSCPGPRVRATSAAGGTGANYMEGICTSYSGTTLVINVGVTGGSGTHADWNLNASGDVGAAGAAGAPGAPGAPGASGTGVAPYITSLIAGPDTTKTITGATHGFATTALLVAAYDNASPRNALQIGWTVNASTYDVIVTFAAPQSNYYITINGGALSGGGGAGTIAIQDNTGTPVTGGPMSTAKFANGTGTTWTLSCVAGVCSLAPNIDTTGLVNTSTNQTVGGIKTFSANPIITPVAVASLPSCGSNSGAIGSVTDAITTLQGATVAGGGSGHGFVFCNGTNWLWMGSNTSIFPPSSAGSSGDFELSAGAGVAMSSFTPGANVKTFLQTPSGANLAAALTTAIPVTSMAASTIATGTSVSLTAPRQYYVCTGTCTVTPPVPAAGYEFCVRNGNNVTTVITLAALGSSARYENTAGTAYGTAGTGTFVSGGAAGDKVCIVGLDSTHYLTLSYSGTWTAN